MKWLHLSDLHIRKNADWDIYKKELLKHCENNGPIDLVIVTGDFHDFADKDDFSSAVIFLKQLIEELHLDISKDLFLIPGNHDGSWPIDAHKKGNIAALKNEPLDANGKEWDELRNQFDTYEKFVRDLIPEYPVEHPAREHCRIWNGAINFIHCNSAVVSDGKDKTQQLLDIDALSALPIPDKIPSVILAHNYWGDIHQEQLKRIKGIIRCNNIKAYFCGDKHRQEVEHIPTTNKQNSQIPCIVSYKTAADMKDTYSAYGVIIGCWEEEKAILKGWTWDADKGFMIDSKVTDQTIEMGMAYSKKPADEEKGGISDECYAPGVCVEVKQCERDIESLEREFRSLYYNMSETQIEQVNRKFVPFMRRLNKNEEVDEIHEFVCEMREKGCTDDMMQYINLFFRR